MRKSVGQLTVVLLSLIFSSLSHAAAAESGSSRDLFRGKHSAKYDWLVQSSVESLFPRIVNSLFRYQDAELRGADVLSDAEARSIKLAAAVLVFEQADEWSAKIATEIDREKRSDYIFYHLRSLMLANLYFRELLESRLSNDCAEGKAGELALAEIGDASHGQVRRFVAAMLFFSYRNLNYSVHKFASELNSRSFREPSLIPLLPCLKTVTFHQNFAMSLNDVNSYLDYSRELLGELQSERAYFNAYSWSQLNKPSSYSCMQGSLATAFGSITALIAALKSTSVGYVVGTALGLGQQQACLAPAAAGPSSTAPAAAAAAAINGAEAGEANEAGDSSNKRQRLR